MLAHLIPHKGKGLLIFLIPLITGFILALIFDVNTLNDKYILPIALTLSAVFIWFYDGGPKIVRDGFKNYQRGNNTLFWIEIKYWAILMGIVVVRCCEVSNQKNQYYFNSP